MASKIQVEFIDDLDGGAAKRTVTFGLDGKLYEIDLSEKNDSNLAKILSPYIAAGRKVTASRTSGRPSHGPNPQNAQIRAWAIEQGYELGDRGRIPLAIIEAYNAG